MKSTWPRLKISKLCELIVDCVNKTAPSVEFETPYKMIRTPNIKNGRIDLSGCRFVEKDTYEKWTRRAKVVKGDVLLTREAPMGEVGLVTFNDTVFLGQRIMQYRANPTKLDSNFLLYAFLSPDLQFQFGRYNNGGSIVSHIRVPDCFEFEINTPTLDLQRKIAGVLGSLDAKISNNNRINAELEAMAKTIYTYWFVQFDFPISKERAKAMGKPRLEGKPYKVSGGKMVWSEELKREVPEGWEVATLGDRIEVQRGLSYSSSDLDDSGIPMINLNSFNLNGTYKQTGLKYFTGKYSEKNRGVGGDLLIAATDVTRNADIIGKAILVPRYYEEDLVYSMDIAKVIPLKGMTTSYLLMLFNSPHYHNYIKWYASGTLVLHLNIDGVRWYKTEIPDPSLLRKYHDFYTPIAERINATQKENQMLAQLRDWLLPMLINGQIKIKSTNQSKVAKPAVSETKPANSYFYQTQLLTAIVKASNKHKISHGEMTLAKYTYLVDKLYGVPTYFNYERLHLGPYPKEMKKIVNNKKFFKIQKNEVTVVQQKKEYNYQFQQEVDDAIVELASVFNQYKGKERSHQTELLATVCKVVEDIKSTDLKAVRESMKNWRIDLKTSKFQNKAEKFSEQETQVCVTKITARGWSRALLSDHIL